MNELSTNFADQIDFFHLDIDQSPTSELMRTLNVRGRSTYVLLSETGEELFRWSGPINTAGVTAQIQGALGN